METRQVRAGRGTVLKRVDRVSTVDILGELIWNAIDAEAMKVDVELEVSPMGAAVEIVVRDDGHGIPHDDAPDLFLTHGESWKRDSLFSPTMRRPMRGRLGEGRFLVYGLADTVEWRSISADGDAFVETLVRGRRDAPDKFDFDGPWPSSGPAGTTVRLIARQTSRAATLADGQVHLPLTARLAATLLALPEVTATYRGQLLNPQEHVTRDVDLQLDVDPAILHGKAAPRLRVVEWSVDMRSKTLHLCDERGAVVTEHKVTRLPPAPIHWTAYLQWEGFRDRDLMGQADLFAPDIRHGELHSAAQEALTGYLSRRLEEEKGSILAEWKAEGAYPYQGEPRSAAEEVERDVFDIVAVVASQAIGKEPKQRKLSLRLLQEATRSEPSRTRRALNAVLDLTQEEEEVLFSAVAPSTCNSTRTVSGPRGTARSAHAGSSRSTE